jgi:putative lipoic acid-binding regulatory protein
MIDLNKHNLSLDYPCSWSYKLIIKNGINIKHIAKDILKDKKHNLSLSNQSKKAKFQSHTLSLEVFDECERKNIFKLLGEHKDIKMVL